MWPWYINVIHTPCGDRAHAAGLQRVFQTSLSVLFQPRQPASLDFRNIAFIKLQSILVYIFLSERIWFIFSLPHFVHLDKQNCLAQIYCGNRQSSHVSVDSVLRSLVSYCGVYVESGIAVRMSRDEPGAGRAGCCLGGGLSAALIVPLCFWRSAETPDWWNTTKIQRLKLEFITHVPGLPAINRGETYHTETLLCLPRKFVVESESD